MVQGTVAHAGHDAVLALEGAGVVSAVLPAADRHAQPLEGFHQRGGLDHVREAVKLLPKKTSDFFFNKKNKTKIQVILFFKTKQKNEH